MTEEAVKGNKRRQGSENWFYGGVVKKRYSGEPSTDGTSVAVKNDENSHNNATETTLDSGVTPIRRGRHSSNQHSGVRTKLFEDDQENQDMEEGIMTKLNTTLTDVANKISKWETKMRSMENSIKLLQGSTSKGGAGKAKQISSFIRVSSFI